MNSTTIITGLTPCQAMVPVVAALPEHLSSSAVQTRAETENPGREVTELAGAIEGWTAERLTLPQ